MALVPTFQCNISCKIPIEESGENQPRYEWHELTYRKKTQPFMIKKYKIINCFSE